MCWLNQSYHLIDTGNLCIKSVTTLGNGLLPGSWLSEKTREPPLRNFLLFYGDSKLPGGTGPVKSFSPALCRFNFAAQKRHFKAAKRARYCTKLS
jgi:hypothetical protein